jgi:hypothetical protein
LAFHAVQARQERLLLGRPQHRVTVVRELSLVTGQGHS